MISTIKQWRCTRALAGSVAMAMMLAVSPVQAQTQVGSAPEAPVALSDIQPIIAHEPTQAEPSTSTSSKKHMVATPDKLGPEPETGVPGSLHNVVVPRPSDLSDYIKDNDSAIRLGKALFWDMQLGSDNQACASCHFHAGADDRSKNELNPGLRANPADHTFQLPAPNYQLKPSDYPFHKLVDRNNRRAGTKSDINDVTGSQGVFYKEFVRIGKNKPVETGNLLPDPDFTTPGGLQLRRVEPRNTPTVINAVFNYANFWDGRASYYFNGNNPFGPLDRNSGIFVADATTGNLQNKIIRIEKSSLASQAVGPPLSDFEMSYSGRGWPDVGKKMLMAKPLGLQIVHPSDSVLGLLSNAKIVGNGDLKKTGLATDYPTLIKQAFWDKYWKSTQIVTYDTNGNPVFSPNPNRKLTDDEFSQMEANFAFFFGLAIQAYESTLVSDQTPFDKYTMNPAKNPLTVNQRLGMGVYTGKGHCSNCHTGAEFTNASMSFREVGPLPGEADLHGRVVELMPVGPSGELVPPEFDVPTLKTAFYDGGWYNIGVRPITDDIGRGGDSPFLNPLTNEPFPLSQAKLGILKRFNQLPPDVAKYIPQTVAGAPRKVESQFAVDGSFKVPSLRNIELTGPYFHNGGQATLRQVIDFYNRGGDFHDENIESLHPDISDKFLTEQEKNNLVDFLMTLTDERVRWEMAPFDHPSLVVPNGAKDGVIVGDPGKKNADGFRNVDQYRSLPAVGAQGLAAEGLPAIGTFLNLDPHKADTSTP